MNRRKNLGEGVQRGERRTRGTRRRGRMSEVPRASSQAGTSQSDMRSSESQICRREKSKRPEAKDKEKQINLS